MNNFFLFLICIMSNTFFNVTFADSANVKGLAQNEGDLLLGDNSGGLTTLGTGTSGQVLTIDGMTGQPTWAANSAAGSVTLASAGGTSFPKVEAANKEAVLICKRRDDPSGLKRLYWRNGMAMDAGQSLRLGAAGGETSYARIFLNM